MLLLGAESLRDVIAFPKLRDGSCPMTGAPDAVDDEQLEVLSLLKERSKHKSPTQAPAFDAERIARLARLELTEAERISLPGQLEAIIGFADALQAVDTSGVPEMTMPGGLCNVLRDDVPTPSLSREEVLASAPTQEDGFITVPRVLDEGRA